MRHNLQFIIALKKTTIWIYNKERNKQIGFQTNLHFTEYILLSKAWNIFWGFYKAIVRNRIKYVEGKESNSHKKC